MKPLPRRLRSEALALGACKVSFDWDHDHPWLIADFAGTMVIQSFSATNRGNGRELKNLICELRRKVFAATGHRLVRGCRSRPTSPVVCAMETPVPSPVTLPLSLTAAAHDFDPDDVAIRAASEDAKFAVVDRLWLYPTS